MDAKRTLLLLCALAAFAIICAAIPWGAARASEGGGNHYPGGNDDFNVGNMPPPGLFLVNYFNLTDSSALKDGSGHKVPVDFKLHLVVDAVRLLWITDKKLLNGNVMFHVVVPVLNQYVKAGGKSQTKTGFGDVQTGIGIAWHLNKHFHHVLALDTLVPVGAYDKKDLINPGRNYWSLNPIWGITYLTDSGFEGSFKLQYFINEVNSATGYQSGEEFSMDYLLAQHVGDWAFGANGHYLYQTTDDKKRNETADFDGNRGENFSLGPTVAYNFKRGSVIAKYEWDLRTRNRAENNQFWLKFIYAF